MDVIRSTGRTLAVAVVAMSAVGLGTIDPTPPQVDTAPAVAVEAVDPPGIYGADEAFASLIEESMARFADAGLSLPPLRIYVHPAADACSGHTGEFMSDGEDDRIDLCGSSTHNARVLHELAHAWEHHSVSEATRRAFLDATGLVWYDPDLPWRERGIEQLATTITWGLLDTPLTDAQMVEASDLMARFELLTGRRTPRAVGS